MLVFCCCNFGLMPAWSRKGRACPHQHIHLQLTELYRRGQGFQMPDGARSCELGRRKPNCLGRAGRPSGWVRHARCIRRKLPRLHSLSWLRAVPQVELLEPRSVRHAHAIAPRGRCARQTQRRAASVDASAVSEGWAQASAECRMGLFCEMQRSHTEGMRILYACAYARAHTVQLQRAVYFFTTSDQPLRACRSSSSALPTAS